MSDLKIDNHGPLTISDKTDGQLFIVTEFWEVARW